MPDYKCFSRQTRLIAIKREKKALRTGNWGEWKKGPPPREQNPFGRGWPYECTDAFFNDAFAVLCREIQTKFGRMVHLAIRNTSSTDIPWRHKQRIKNELCGEHSLAVEVFPSTKELVDEANMYHLWVYPKDFKLPFSLK